MRRTADAAAATPKSAFVIGSIEISLSALRNNAQLLRDLVGPGHAAFVVKGNAYGHGIVETALAVEPFARKLCVYSVDEAIALRDGGVTAPILILGPIPPDALDEAMQTGAEVALWDTGEYVRALAAAAHRAHQRVKVHVKVNTGLNRLGLAPEELQDAVEDYCHITDLEIAGIFSHLASAEEIDSPYTMFQLERFNQAYTQAEPVLASHGALPIRHIAASAAAMLWPQTRLDMSRFGIALYGLWPSPQTREAMNGGKLPLQPVLSYRTQLITTRQIGAGEAVGYGTTFHAPRTMRIGVVPVGYADGVPRALGNAGAALVDGVRCPIIGRVAMNMSVLDLSRAPQARSGTAVTLIGRDGDDAITADDWGAWTNSINYEVVTRLPSSIPRIYSDESK
ncbi:MAG TPA: alanine racemase [Candidatus Baltobacteraceae bacterium]|nr:alanine racemase [Candidatus Baltobacteraceae bacterium]